MIFFKVSGAISTSAVSFKASLNSLSRIRDFMVNRATAGVANALLWGIGYLYSGRGLRGIFAVLAHLNLYAWSFLLGFQDVILWGPTLLLGSIYFGLDGYRYSSAARTEPQEKVRKGVCRNCGRKISSSAKFCPECGTSQSGND